MGPAMNKALEELRGEVTATAVAEKFGIDVRGRPTTITLRGQARAKDGRIHTDSKDKLITFLIYLNPGWVARTGGGCLRLLRSASDIDDYETEIPARMGALAAFACAPNAYHGHLPFEGRRRSIQLNWVVNEAAADRTLTRHRRSAFWKKLNPFKSETGVNGYVKPRIFGERARGAETGTGGESTVVCPCFGVG